MTAPDRKLYSELVKSLLTYLPIATGVLVLVLSLGVAVFTVTKRNSVGELAIDQDLRTQASQVSLPNLSLSPENESYVFSAGQTYPVGIILDSGDSEIDGVDVVIMFDPKKARVVTNQVSSAGLLEQVPLNRVDNITGKIIFSALTFKPKVVNGILGSFRFEPLVTGQVDFKFDFKLGATVDSNVAQHGSANDALGKVVNATYTFK